MDANLPNALKRCSSAPIINNLATTSNQMKNNIRTTASATVMTSTSTSNSSSREPSPAPIMNIFTPRARRYSASFASIGGGANTGPCLTPRVSQLRQEECLDINSREINHEREVHSAMQMSQSWEDLTIESWSSRSDDLSHPLQVSLTSNAISCSSPSPTSRTGMRLPYGPSPSPTRRTFATRRSMSPIAMRPSQLGPVKRKFELDENYSTAYSPPPLKKIFTESRGPSPICQSPSSVCPSPDSGTYEGRITPKLFATKLYANSSSSLCSSPMVPSPILDAGIDLQSNNSSSPANTISSSSEPVCMSSFEVDVDTDLKSNNEVKSFNDDTFMDSSDNVTEISKTIPDSTTDNINLQPNINKNAIQQDNSIKKSPIDNKQDRNNAYDNSSAIIVDKINCDNNSKLL